VKKILIIFLLIALAGGFFYFFVPKREKISQALNTIPDKTLSAGSENIPAVIVPHFDFFKDKRLELLQTVAKKTDPKTVILVSVNHFNSGTADILTTERDFEVQAGKVRANQDLVKKLASSEIALSDEAAFTDEHGIKNILADLKQTFPDTDLLPIIIKDQAQQSQIDALSNWIKANCKDCLLVSSVDFSHYCPRALARVHPRGGSARASGSTSASRARLPW
jgi:AmmeMemoRadiSam system protein B